jgi:copper chaperone CopZ
MTTTTYLVAGMSCDHCAHAVTTQLSDLPGVESVGVQMADGRPTEVSVTSAGPLDEATVRAAVDEAGYDLVGVATG